MGPVPWEDFPDEVWTLIFSNATIQTLLHVQNVNRRFETLVESVPLFRDYINEEEEIIQQLVLNWLGSPFDIVLPLTEDDWELLCPVLRARFRCLVRNRPGGFEEIVERAKQQDKSHYMVNKGWLYKSFLRNLHEEQRKQLIEPLRGKFINKLKNQTYICKKCGAAFTPAHNDVCHYHQYETAIKCDDYEDNVWELQCCPGVIYFARGNQIPLPNVRRHLGHCRHRLGRSDAVELHVNDDFIDLKLSTQIFPEHHRYPREQYNKHYAVDKAAKDEGTPLRRRHHHRHHQHHTPPSAPAQQQAVYPAVPYYNNQAQNQHHQHNDNSSCPIHTLSHLSLNPPTTTNHSVRYPNPKTNHRFDKTDWADFFDNDYEYEDEQERRKKNAKKRKNRQNGQNHNSQSSTMGKERKEKNQPAVASASLPSHVVSPIEEPHFQNPPGEFEIGVWRPT